MNQYTAKECVLKNETSKWGPASKRQILGTPLNRYWASSISMLQLISRLSPFSVSKLTHVHPNIPLRLGLRLNIHWARSLRHPPNGCLVSCPKYSPLIREVPRSFSTHVPMALVVSQETIKTSDIMIKRVSKAVGCCILHVWLISVYAVFICFLGNSFFLIIQAGPAFPCTNNQITENASVWHLVARLPCILIVETPIPNYINLTVTFRLGIPDSME